MTPYEAEKQDLPETRIRQRRRLASVPDFILERVKVPPVDQAHEEYERPLLEYLLRQRADLVEDEIAEILDRQDSANRARVEYFALQRFVHGPWFFDEVPADLNDILERDWVRDVQGPERMALHRYLALLVWADELAEDGYRDPRLTGSS